MEPRWSAGALSRRLKYLREQVVRTTTRGFADEIRERAGLDVSHVSVVRYESDNEEDRRTPGADYIAAVCEAFDVNPGWILFGDTPRERSALGAADPYRQGAESAITAMFERLLEIAESVGIEWPTAPAGGEEGREERLAKRMKAVAKQRREHHRGDIERRSAGHDR